MTRRTLLPALLLPLFLTAQQPIPESETIAPADVAANIKDWKLIHVGFPVTYRLAHIPGSELAGPASKPDGLDLLKKAVADLPHDRQIVLYCGCCPWDKCPNIRPALAALRAMGFTHVRAMSIPTSFKTDWTDKGYPVEKSLK